jgi:hypothetical protein
MGPLAVGLASTALLAAAALTLILLPALLTLLLIALVVCHVVLLDGVTATPGSLLTFHVVN